MAEKKKKLLIGSLQFSPIFKSHCCALGSLAEKNGFDVRYIFSREYAWMLPDAVREKTIFIGGTKDIKTGLLDGCNPLLYTRIRKTIRQGRPDFIYMYNFHPFFNRYLAALSKRYGSTFIQHVHEPHYENRTVYGGLMQYWLPLFESFQGRLLTDTDIVIISSRISRELFRKRYPEYTGKVVQAPLIYEDLRCELPDKKIREYISLVGPPVPAKGPEIFLRIAASAQTSHPQIKFRIISRMPVNDPRFCRNNNVCIVNKKHISDEEMGDLLQESIAVLTPYKAATQSSVAITAYMVGTPVLSSDVGGLPEFVHHRETGFLVDVNAPVEKWIEGIEYIIAHRNEMSGACRQFFLKDFSETGWQKHFEDIFISRT